MAKEATVSLKNTPEEKIIFFSSQDKIKELQDTALQIANSSNLPMRLEISFNKCKTTATIKVILLAK